jgi:nitronate monooxygenase
MGAFMERIGVERPVLQAGMGGGLSGAQLAAAVSEAGGLGTIGILGPDQLREEIASARRLTRRPIAVNLLLVLAHRDHFEAAEQADVLVTFWGKPRRRTSRAWIHQVGSVDEALHAKAAGADAVIAQGVESGGHVRGTVPAAELLSRIRSALRPDYPVLSAGGIVTAEDVGERLEAGAEAVVSGTRFLLSEESRAHPRYKERLLEARQTLVTELFGLGWPAPHRVVPNAATERWLRSDPRGPRWVRAIHRLSSVGASRVPISIQLRLAASQKPSRPLFGPAAPTVHGPATLVDAGPLYAGESIARIDDIRPAAELIEALTPR